MASGESDFYFPDPHNHANFDDFVATTLLKPGDVGSVFKPMHAVRGEIKELSDDDFFSDVQVKKRHGEWLTRHQWSGKVKDDGRRSFREPIFWYDEKGDKREMSPSLQSALDHELLTREEEVNLTRMVRAEVQWQAILDEMEEPEMGKWAKACGLDLDEDGFTDLMNDARKKEYELRQWEKILRALEGEPDKAAKGGHALINGTVRVPPLGGVRVPALGRKATKEEWAMACGMDVKMFAEKVVEGRRARQNLNEWFSKHPLGIAPVFREASMEEWAKACGFSKWEEFDAALEAAGNAREELTEKNGRLVFSIAQSITIWPRLSDDDMFQEGMIGLMKAIDRFDPERGFKLATYATPYIRRAMLKASAEKSTLISIPEHIRAKIRKVRGLEAESVRLYGEVLPHTQLAKYLGLDIKEFEKVKVYQAREIVKSGFTDMFSDDKELPPEMLVYDPDIIKMIIVEQTIQGLMKLLKPFQRDVVSMRFGLKKGSPPHMKQQEIADALNVTKAKVAGAYYAALRILKGSEYAKNPIYNPALDKADRRIAGRMWMGREEVLEPS